MSNVAETQLTKAQASLRTAASYCTQDPQKMPRPYQQEVLVEHTSVISLTDLDTYLH